MPDKKRLLVKEYKKVKKQEYQMTAAHKNTMLAEKIMPLFSVVNRFLPENLQTLLENAFFSGFRYVFLHGTDWIKGKKSKENAKEEFCRNYFSLERNLSEKNLKRLERQANQEVWKRKSLTALEGTFLGIVGIGLFDIPIFIAVMLNTIYDICLRYGYDYHRSEERKYILAVICAASADTEDAPHYLALADDIGLCIEREEESQAKEEELMQRASSFLALEMLQAKAIQGFPVIGVIGGIFNYIVLKKVSDLAKIKYKKRFLLHLGRK